MCFDLLKKFLNQLWKGFTESSPDLVILWRDAFGLLSSNYSV